MKNINRPSPFPNNEYRITFIGNWTDGEKEFLKNRFGVKEEQFVNYEKDES